MRPDLADDLRRWLADRLASLQANADIVASRSRPVCRQTPPSSTCRAGLVRIFDRDLKAAGIPKRDDRGRTLDVHALRTTFGTLLSKGGVPLRTAQAAMRHSDPSLTANVYTDPKLLDVSGALDALPTLAPPGPSPIGSKPEPPGPIRLPRSPLALPLALTPDKSGRNRAMPGKSNIPSLRSAGADSSAVSGLAWQEKGPADNPCQPALFKSGRQDLNLRPLDPQSSALAKLRYAPPPIKAFAHGESHCRIFPPSVNGGRRGECRAFRGSSDFGRSTMWESGSSGDRSEDRVLAGRVRQGV